MMPLFVLLILGSKLRAASGVFFFYKSFWRGYLGALYIKIKKKNLSYEQLKVLIYLNIFYYFSNLDVLENTLFELSFVPVPKCGHGREFISD